MVQSKTGEIVHETLSHKTKKNNNPQNRAGGVVHGAKHLPNKHEALSLSPRTSKKISKRKVKSHRIHQQNCIKIEIHIHAGVIGKILLGNILIHYQIINLF
jgi:hypothetical protein